MTLSDADLDAIEARAQQAFAEGGIARSCWNDVALEDVRVLIPALRAARAEIVRLGERIAQVETRCPYCGFVAGPDLHRGASEVFNLHVRLKHVSGSAHNAALSR